jgi:phosphoglycolate phosphatase
MNTTPTARAFPEHPKAVIFDLDGTLIDSLPDIANVANAALESFGLPRYSVQAYRAMVGWGLAELARLALEGLEGEKPPVEQLTGRIVELYEKYPFEYGAAYPGIAQLLGRLSDAGIRLAVLTNKRHEVAVQTVAKAFPEIGFGYVRGDREGHPRKPDPATVAEVLDALGVDASGTVFVGDSDVDMQTAAGMNVFSVGVSWGYRDADHLRAAGADRVIDSPHELLSTGLI